MSERELMANEIRIIYNILMRPNINAVEHLLLKYYLKDWIRRAALRP